MATEAVFSVSLFTEKGKIKTNLVKNAIKRISTKLTWEDLLDMCIENVSEDDLPDDISFRSWPQWRFRRPQLEKHLNLITRNS